MTAPFDPDRLLAALHAHQVDFVLIGGMAAILHGDTGVTVDLDIVPRRDPDNLSRLAQALRTLDARIRAEGVSEGRAFDCSAAFLQSLSPDAILNLTTSAGDLDLTFEPSGTRGFADLRRNAVQIALVDEGHVLIAALADIIRSKEAADRAKDRLALPRLRRLLDRLRQESPDG